MTRTYEARYVAQPGIRLDGVLDEPAWRTTEPETRFAFPWDRRPLPHTEFRALFDAEALYFAFSVDDDDVVLAEPFGGKADVVREDRVELFFAVDENLAEYYCLEIDPLGRVLDYRARHYREFDFSWSFPGLEVAGVQTAGGYDVEGRIPLASLASLGFPSPASGRPINLGIYRAEFRHGNGPDPIEGWISWIDPETQEPDFHVPESFGRLTMVP